MTDISIVIPLFNEAGNISELVAQLRQEMAPMNMGYEILLVDDGSEDATWAEIEGLSNGIAEVIGLKLSRNFGHQNALLAGLSHASGRAIISMDGDLQHPPSLLPTMIESWQQGNKVVHTKKANMETLGGFKKRTSNWFYSIFSWLTGVKMERGVSDFRLIDQQVLAELLKFKDVDPFIRGSVVWLGFEHCSASVEYEVGERLQGESAYTLRKMLSFANSAVVSFSTKPLILGIWIGMLTSVVAFVELGYILYTVMSGYTVPGWASTVGIMSLLFGVLFILLGVIGLYLARIHSALQDRPKYVVDQLTERPPESNDSSSHTAS